jgi:arsenate reductase
MQMLRILFVCVGNTCRSPMAEALARHLSGGRVEACSAGCFPTGRLEQSTVAALERLGVSAEGLWSKGFDAVPLDDIDLVVSLAGPAVVRDLPVSLRRSAEVWSIRDPYGEEPAVYLAVARIIAARVQDLLDRLDCLELPGR